MPKLSIVIPLYNEAANLPLLFERLGEALPLLNTTYEVILVDDGSKDGSFDVIKQLTNPSRPVIALRLDRNYGQTAALAAGIDRARGEIIVTLDSDLENDPRDIPRVVQKLEEGYDVVSGWRQNRWKGSYLSRKLPSVLANGLISRITKVPLHDYGCTLKAYRAELLKGVNLYGEMHRFIPAYAAWRGGKVTEIPVTYAPRIHGKSNYGMGRIFRVLPDLVLMKFMHRYFARPMHFFGSWGLVSFVIGAFAAFMVIVLKIFGLSHLIESLPIIALLFLLTGVQFVLFGVMAEILMRTYYESQQKRPYGIKTTIE